MRDRKTVVDRPLTEVLDNPADRTERRRAKSLVSQIQRHYESVRSSSLRNVRTPGAILDSAIERLQQFDSNISLNKPQSAPSSSSSKRDQGHWKTKTQNEWHRGRVRVCCFLFSWNIFIDRKYRRRPTTSKNRRKRAQVDLVEKSTTIGPMCSWAEKCHLKNQYHNINVWLVRAVFSLKFSSECAISALFLSFTREKLD